MPGRFFLRVVACFLLLLATTLTAGGCAVPIKPMEPLSTYEVGRLAITVPQSMKPLVTESKYTWDSRTPANESYVLGYPITLWEQPYANRHNADAELAAAIAAVRKKAAEDLILEWDVSQIFGLPAYFLCYEFDGPIYQFHVILKANPCLLHLEGHQSYDQAEKPQKNAETEGVLQAMATLYTKYRPGHYTRSGNVFYTFYGEIVDNTANHNETMKARFKNTTGRVNVITNSLPTGTVEGQEVRVARLVQQGLPRNRMRGTPHFGRGFESTIVSNNYGETSWEYFAPGKDPQRPSIDVTVSGHSQNMSQLLGIREVVLEYLRLVQEPRLQREARP